MITVSVIVPVYNVETYLPQCLQSIVSQSYSQLEVLLVDDGSTDRSGHICDEWASHDQRIRVIHKPNGGLSDARNAALDAMSGEVVMMVDGDDYLQLDAIEQLLDIMQRERGDIAVGGWQLVTEDSEARFTHPTPHSTVHTMSGIDALNKMLYQTQLTHSACGRLFKRDVFDSLRFPVGMLYEDLAVAYPLYRSVKRVAVCDSPYYCYRQRSSSITGHFTLSRTHVLDILENLAAQVADELPQLLPAVRSRQLSAYFNIMLLCPNQAQYHSTIDRCWRGVKSLRWSCLTDRQVRLKNKLGILASVVGKQCFHAFFSKGQ